MENIFDRVGALVFDTIAKTFGYECQWQPSGNQPLLVAIVGFGEPTEDISLGTGRFQSQIDDWQITNYWIEYKLSDLPGLYESVRSGNSETIKIKSKEFPQGRNFPVSEALKSFDGRTYKLKLLNPY